MSTHPLNNQMLAMHTAVMGKTGSGKTYAAKGAVENLLAEGAQVVVLDPTSAWWGLRLKPDGKTPAYDRVIVMGGRRGDIPLSPDPAQAEAVARVVWEQGLSVVLDTGDMGVGERTRWAGRFAETLYRMADSTRALHLVIDEAHCFAPQGSIPSPDVGIMVHAFNQLASGGRSRGLRLLLITQRPAKLHKDSLTSCDTLVALRVIAPQDRKAIEEWIDGCGDRAKAREVLDSLAQLKRGEGWVWCPELDPMPHQRKFPAIVTYDSSATPTGGERREVQMGEVDTAALGKLIASAGEQIKADDPKALKARIRELEGAAKATPAGSSEEELKGEYARGFEAGNEDCRRRLRPFIGLFNSALAGARSVAEQFSHEWEAVAGTEPIRPEAEQSPGVRAAMTQLADMGFRRVTASAPKPVGSTYAQGQTVLAAADAKIPGATLNDRILNAVAWFAHAGRFAPTKDQVAALLGYHPNTKSYANAVGALRSSGELDPDRNGMVLRKPRPWTGGNATAASMVLAQLSGRKREIFSRLLQSPASRDALAAGFNVHPNTKSFNNDLSALCGLGVVERSRGELRVAEWIGGAA